MVTLLFIYATACVTALQRNMMEVDKNRMKDLYFQYCNCFYISSGINKPVSTLKKSDAVLIHGALFLLNKQDIVPLLWLSKKSLYDLGCAECVLIGTSNVF